MYLYEQISFFNIYIYMSKLHKELPRDFKNHRGHLGDGMGSYTTKIIKTWQGGGYAYYETRNSIYYHHGVLYCAVKCNCPIKS